MSQPPEKGSKEWVRNESIINKNPVLKRARDQAEGLSSRGTIVSGGNSKAYQDGWDRIFGGNRENVNHRDDDEQE